MQFTCGSMDFTVTKIEGVYMRQKAQNFRDTHGDTARVVLFQLAALTVDCFLLWPRRDANPVKTAINCTYAALLHGAAYMAAKYLETPKVQFSAHKKATEENNETTNSASTVTPGLVCPATP